MVVLGLIGSHYIAYVLGEESRDMKWVERMRLLQKRFDDYMDEELRNLQDAKIAQAKRVRKVAVKKK